MNFILLEAKFLIENFIIQISFYFIKMQINFGLRSWIFLWIIKISNKLECFECSLKSKQQHVRERISFSAKLDSAYLQNFDAMEPSIVMIRVTKSDVAISNQKVIFSNYLISLMSWINWLCILLTESVCLTNTWVVSI